ncbi:MAG TPA: hypothetical protein VF384_05015 [Planctomycetota bacterium]
MIPLVVCSLLFQLPAKADKFWLSDPEVHNKNAVAGSLPDVIEGVLVSEDADGYHIRTVGGEVVLPKKSVFRIEKDGLTLDAVVKAEADAAKVNAAADQERQMAQTAERRANQAKAMEAAARRTDAPVEPAPAATAPEVPYDPVLDVIPSRGAGSQAALMRELRHAFEVSGDRSFLKELRMARRTN